MTASGDPASKVESGLLRDLARVTSSERRCTTV
jgi:hypothetical protein